MKKYESLLNKYTKEIETIRELAHQAARARERLDAAPVNTNEQEEAWIDWDNAVYNHAQALDELGHEIELKYSDTPLAPGRQGIEKFFELAFHSS